MVVKSVETLTQWFELKWVVSAALGCWAYFWVLSQGVRWALRKQHPPFLGLFLLIKGMPLMIFWAVFSKNGSFVVLLSLTLGIMIGVAVFSVVVCLRRSGV